MKLVIYVTDIHADESEFKKALDKAMKKNAEAVIIGGDLSSQITLYAVNSIEAQKLFYELRLIPLLRNFRKKSKIPVFIMMGNDDHSINQFMFDKLEKEGIVINMHKRRNKLCGKTIFGYSFVNPSEYFIFPINDWVKKEEEMKKELETSLKDIEHGFIFVPHTPPINTNLDMYYDGNHVGSSTIREIIEKKKPSLCLSGHIHESAVISGEMSDKIGETVCINPGNANVVGVDLDTGKITRI